MKKLFFFVIIVCLSLSPALAQVGIGGTPNPNAELDVISTDKGVLLPSLNQAEADALEANLSATENGMTIYNTDEGCIQIYNDASVNGFECIFVTSNAAEGNAGVVKVNLGSPGSARVAANTDNGLGDPLNLGDTSHPGYISVGPGAGDDVDYGDRFDLNFALSDLILSSAPTTNFPENVDPANNVSGTNNPGTNIYRPAGSPLNSDTADRWIENPLPGQVQFWRVTAFINANPSICWETSIEFTIRNPDSGFETSTTQVAPNGVSGIFEVSFVVSTIADGASIPQDLDPNSNAGANGYVLSVRPGPGTLPSAVAFCDDPPQGNGLNDFPLPQIWIDSITRISVFDD